MLQIKIYIYRYVRKCSASSGARGLGVGATTGGIATIALRTYTKWGRRNMTSLVGLVGICSLVGFGCGVTFHSNSDFIKYRVKEDHVVSESHLARKRAMKEIQEMDRLEKEREKIFDDVFFGENNNSSSSENKKSSRK